MTNNGTPGVVLVESRRDPASTNIAHALRTHHRWTPDGTSFDGHPVHHAGATSMVTIDALHLHADDLPARLDAAGITCSTLVFLSKHRAESGRPSLTVHPIGNPTAAAAYGGQPRRLSPAAPQPMTDMLRALIAARDAHDYPADATFEATHHGPLIDRPGFFLELGSGPDQWTDPAGARVVADAAMYALGTQNEAGPVAIGVGGGHYAPQYTRAAATHTIHYGHILANHSLEADAPSATAQLKAARDATPGATSVHIDRKSLPQPLRQPLIKAIEALGLQRLRTRDLTARTPQPPLRDGHH